MKDLLIYAGIIVKSGSNILMLKRCVESVMKEVDKIIIQINAEVRDNEFYEYYGKVSEALVFDNEIEIFLDSEIWRYDFSGQRNILINTVKNNNSLFFFIDADEELITKVPGDLKSVLTKTFLYEDGAVKTAAAFITIQNTMPDGSTMNLEEIRFVTNAKKINYFGIFNESPILDIQKENAEIFNVVGPVIKHHGWSTAQLLVAKEERNMGMLNWQIDNGPQQEKINYIAIRANLLLKAKKLISAEIDINTAIEMMGAEPNPLTAIQVYNTAAMISASYKRFDETARRCQLSISFEKKVGLKHKQILPRMLLAETYEIWKDYGNALAYYSEVKEAILAGSPQIEFVFSVEQCDQAIQRINQHLKNKVFKLN